MKVLITGGAGFIGSTIASACLDAGMSPVVLDDLSAGRREFTAGRPGYEGAITDAALLDRIFDEHPDIDAVVHCAARVVVPESVAHPATYFNPIGADPQLRTGPQHRQPTHALGRLIAAHESGTPFTVAGTDWPTRDGSAIRDFVHVWDLARAHVAALERFDDALDGATHRAINLGTGRGTTVHELVDAFRTVVDGGLRVLQGPGDQATSWAPGPVRHRRTVAQVGS